MVSKEKELELINTIKEMLKNGDSEEDIISIFEGFGLDKEYIKTLIKKAKGGKTLHEYFSPLKQEQKDNNLIKDTQISRITYKNTQQIDSKSLDEIKELKEQIKILNEKIENLNNDIAKIKEDTEATRLILEKLMKVYRSVLNKLLAKYS